MLKADLHVHSEYSPDSESALADIIDHCRATGINCVAITDHNETAGAVELKKIAPFTVIVGEEILTSSGEIIGLFLTERIPPRLSAQETVKRIKNQGGLVLIPHPFDRYFRPSVIDRDALEKIVSDIDIIEVFNSHTVIRSDSGKALKFAQAHGLLASAGSDAHLVSEIGNAYIEIPDFASVDEFKKALAKGKLRGQMASPFHRLKSIVGKLVRKTRKFTCTR
ncbi:PHP-associated domain-containing protein [Chloroflexota bacterium]